MCLKISRQDLILFLPLLFVAAFLRLFRLGGLSFAYDEIGQAIVAQNYVWEVIKLSATHAASTPLDYVLTFAMLKLGNGEAILRLPAALFGITSVGLMYLIGRMVMGRAVGFLSAFALTLIPLHVSYSSTLRFYSIAVFFSLLSTWLLLRAVERKHWVDWLLYGTAITLGMYSHYYIAILVMIHGLWCIWLTISKAIAWRDFGVFVIVAVVSGALFAPWVYYDNVIVARGATLSLEGGTFRLCGDRIRLLILPFAYASAADCNLSGLFSRGMWDVTYGIWALFMAGWLLAWFQPTRERNAHLLFLLLPLIGLPAIWGLDYLGRYPVNSRQTLVFTPYLLLGASMTVMGLLRSVPRVPSRYVVPVGMSLVVALFAWGIRVETKQYVESRLKNRSEGVRELVNFLNANMPLNDILVVGFPQHVKYYAPNLRAVRVRWQETEADIAPLLQKYERVWILPWMPNYADALQDYAKAKGAWQISPVSSLPLAVLSANDPDAGLKIAQTLLSVGRMSEVERVRMAGNIGRTLLATKRADEGIAIMEPFVKSGYTSSSYWLTLANLYRLNLTGERKPKAVDLLEKVIAEEPWNIDANLSLADIYADSGDWTKATPMAEHAYTMVKPGTYRDGVVLDLLVRGALTAGDLDLTCRLWQELLTKAETGHNVFKSIIEKHSSRITELGGCAAS